MWFDMFLSCAFNFTLLTLDADEGGLDFCLKCALPAAHSARVDERSRRASVRQRVTSVAMAFIAFSILSNIKALQTPGIQACLRSSV